MSFSRRMLAVLLPIFMGWIGVSEPCEGQPLDQGTAFLVSTQQADGRWESEEVRDFHVTTVALQALQVLDRAPGSRSAAAGFLTFQSIPDQDDLARRLGVLATEGRDVSALTAQLIAAAASQGGWGLTSSFHPDPLDTALALQALTGIVPPSEDLVRQGLMSLLTAQRGDGGFACVTSPEADSEIFCTSHALVALEALSSTYSIEPAIQAAVGFLRGQMNVDGSFGPVGSDDIIHTALASVALAGADALGADVLTVIAYLEGRQQIDGSWQQDPYPTALASRALATLYAVPFCGDGARNRGGEACDGGDLADQTCEGIGLGEGTLSCTAQCTLDTTGCAEPPVCGDQLRNQPAEVCDGVDLGAETCASLGFSGGSLACADDCSRFDFSSCTDEEVCGDGVINQPGELCDLSDLDGATCATLGLGGGLLQCGSDCNLDTSLCDAASFTIDNKGREFLVAFLQNQQESFTTAALHLVSDVETTATVQYPVNAPSFVQTVTVRPGIVTVVNLPSDAHFGWTAGEVLNNAVRISSPEEIAVFMVNQRFATSDGALALPVDALGRSYFVTTFRGSIRNPSDRPEFIVVAPFNGTQVTITPTTTLRFPDGNKAPGVPVEIQLDRGEGVRIEATFSRTDLTGTRVVSDRPVFLINGNTCTNIPSHIDACDHIFEVAHPVSRWGNTALVTNLPRRAGGSLYRILASVNGTVITLDDVPQAILDRGQFLEVSPLPGSHVFAADHPIFVTQFLTGTSSPGASTGDPSMVNVIPPDQFLEEYTFLAASNKRFPTIFLTVTARTTDVGSVMLDGKAIFPLFFSPIPGSEFSSAVVTLREGSHTINSPQPHGITVACYGLSESFMFPGGTRVGFTNPFCGDGVINRPAETCDGSDFAGANCATLGFSSGFLQCTAECQIDAARCSGFAITDRDEDGFPSSEDCDDSDPERHPGMVEMPGNGVDDDCNPATPDDLPEGALRCSLESVQITYLSTDLVGLEGEVANDDPLLSLAGLELALVVRQGSGEMIIQETRSLNPLPPGSRSRQNFTLSAAALPPGEYEGEMILTTSGELIAVCATTFTLESSASTGAGLSGTLSLDPALVNAGESSEAQYTLTHQGNAALLDLAVRVVLVDPITGAGVGEVIDIATLEPGGSFTAAQPLSTTDLASNQSYLAVLLARPVEGEGELTLDSTALTVVNAPPECSGAFADPVEIWPPNHKWAEVGIEGVTDPDGDPIILTVSGILQDERTDDLGSGDTCPDASGVGTSRARLRAERSGRQDGRVYHVFFEAQDGRGGTCEGVVTVCVPHDRKRGCGDQGGLFDSGSCG